MRRAVLGVLIVVCLAGCASLTPSKAMQSWVGQQYGDMMLKWGPPTRTAPDGRGGQIVIYEYNRDMGQTPGRAVRNPDGSVSYTAPQSNGYVATRMFWVNADGVIYNWRWQGF